MRSAGKRLFRAVAILSDLTPRAAVAALVLIGMGVHGARAQIKTGKSDFWRKLEAGQVQKYIAMGTSVSQTKNSYWPADLARYMSNKFGAAFTTFSSYTARQGFNSFDAIRETLPVILKQKPDALSIEYQITDSYPEDYVSLAQSKANICKIIDEVRKVKPTVDIFLWEAVYPKCCHDRPNLDEYYHMYERIALEKNTYLVNTYDRFKQIYDSLAAAGNVAGYTRWVYDTHHPSQYAGTTIIVPAFVAAFSGSATINSNVKLSVGSLAGQTFRVGDTVRVQWYADASLGGLLVSASVGGAPYVSLTAAPVTGQSFVWPVPVTLGGASTVTDRAVVRVTDTSKATIDSTGAFRILEAAAVPAIWVNSLAGSSYAVGDNLTVRYTFDTTRIESVVIKLSPNGGATYYDISPSSLRETSFTWKIASQIGGVSTVSSNVYIRVDDYQANYCQATGPLTIRSSGTAVSQGPPAISVGMQTRRDVAGRDVDLRGAAVGDRRASIRAVSRVYR